MVSKGRSQEEDWHVLADHVGPYPIKVGYVSSFNAALEDARKCTGRDLASGDVKPNESRALWAGTFVYLVLLEQIGKTLRPRGGRDLAKEHELERAIRQFVPGVTNRQRQAVYALRCAFAHDYGLFNVNRRRPGYTHVSASMTTQIFLLSGGLKSDGLVSMAALARIRRQR